MRTLTRALALLCLAAAGCAPLFAQFQPDIYAINYGQWSIPLQQANTYLFSPGSICSPPNPYGAGNFFAFNTNAAVYISDRTTANSELVTPSAVTNNNAQCGVSISPSNNHYSANLVSGTAGLQEALNQISASNLYPARVILEKNWYNAIANVGQTARTVIAAAKGNAAIMIVDRTTNPETYWTWNASASTPAYVNSGVTGGPTKPTGALSGTGTSGTGGTITTAGNGNEGTVTVVTGTGSLSTGAFFTLTWGSSGSFTAAPKACGVFASVNSPATPPAATQAITYSSGAIDTVTTTAAAAASTTYIYQYSCQAGQ